MALHDKFSKEQAASRIAFEQSLASFSDTLPRMWYACYRGCIEAGFTDKQSLNLLQTWILSTSNAGIRPSNPPENDKEKDE